MKHVIVGLAASLVVFFVFVFTALLAMLVGPEWAIAMILAAIVIGLAAGLIDYLTEKESAA